MSITAMDKNNEHIDPVGLLPKVFAGEADPGENRLVEEWVSASAANRTEYEAFSRLWNLTAATSAPGEIDIDREWQRIESVITPSPSGKTIPVRILQIAASVILISALAFFGMKFTGSKSEKAPAAALSSVILPDGTSLFLNAGSRVTYKKGFGITHRNLTLKGEAYFEIKKDSGLPFLISAGEATIRVTGTKFNVKAYHNQGNVRVTVTEGMVTLYNAGRPGEEVKLSAGETGLYDKKNRMVKKQFTENLNDLAWKTRIMDFHNTPLAEVAEILMNTYHKPIEIEAELRNCSVTVRFENQELEAVLSVLKSTLGLDLVTRGKHIVISGKGC